MKRFLFATLLCAIGHSAFGADTDGDGLLDLIDAPGFDSNASGDVQFIGFGIQDLDGANLLTNVTTLHLYRNQITSFENGDFQRLGNLEYLLLFDNRTASLESGAFRGLGNLQSLDLGNNQITTLENGVFQGLSNLQSLGLYDNQITTLESGAFQGLSNLQTLLLDDNIIQKLNLTGATFDSLRGCEGIPFGGVVGFCADTAEITDLILDDAVLSLGSFQAIVGQTKFIANLSLVGLSFSDTSPDDLSNLLTLESLDNVRLDQALFDQHSAEFNAFDAIPGNTVTVVPEPSVFCLSITTIGLVWLPARRRRHTLRPPTLGCRKLMRPLKKG
jgi:hypothetical protein